MGALWERFFRWQVATTERGAGSWLACPSGEVQGLGVETVPPCLARARVTVACPGVASRMRVPMDWMFDDIHLPPGGAQWTRIGFAPARNALVFPPPFGYPEGLSRTVAT